MERARPVPATWALPGAAGILHGHQVAARSLPWYLAGAACLGIFAMAVAGYVRTPCRVRRRLRGNERRRGSVQTRRLASPPPLYARGGASNYELRTGCSMGLYPGRAAYLSPSVHEWWCARGQGAGGPLGGGGGGGSIVPAGNTYSRRQDARDKGQRLARGQAHSLCVAGQTVEQRRATRRAASCAGSAATRRGRCRRAPAGCAPDGGRRR